MASIIARRGFEDRPEAEVTIATALPDTDGITTLQLPTTPLRVRGALTPPPPPHAAADAKTVYHLYCGALDDAPDAAQGGCGSLVCSRAMDTRTFHGLPANFRFTTKPGSRPGRMIRAFTSDCPPPTDRVAILGQVERAQEDCGPVAEPGARDGCTCVRVALGCRTWCGDWLVIPGLKALILLFLLPVVITWATSFSFHAQFVCEIAARAIASYSWQTEFKNIHACLRQISPSAVHHLCH